MASDLTWQRIEQTSLALDARELRRNKGDYHIFTILAHAGKHSQGERGVLKEQIYDDLYEWGYEEDADFCADYDEGLFLLAL
jgi:hypothetical protein